MAEETTSFTGSSGEAAEPTESVEPPPDAGAGRTRKSKKKRYSAGTRETQQFERRLNRSARRVARAVADGFDTYMDRREKSARKKRDGAIIDGFENVARGMAKAVANASPAITDAAKGLNTKRTRRGIKSIARAIRFPFS